MFNPPEQVHLLHGKQVKVKLYMLYIKICKPQTTATSIFDVIVIYCQLQETSLVMKMRIQDKLKCKVKEKSYKMQHNCLCGKIYIFYSFF